jgi:hypothetical protein
MYVDSIAFARLSKHQPPFLVARPLIEWNFPCHCIPSIHDCVVLGYHHIIILLVHVQTSCVLFYRFLKLHCCCNLLLQIYGYVTTSDVKILALLDRDGIVPIKKRKEVDIKIMFVSSLLMMNVCVKKRERNKIELLRDGIAHCSFLLFPNKLLIFSFAPFRPQFMIVTSNTH